MQNTDVDFQVLKTTLAEKINLGCRESLNSSGTVSRKTSTASEYTPEHTYVHDSRAHFMDQTTVSYSTESCVSVTEAISLNTKPTDDLVTKKNQENSLYNDKSIEAVSQGETEDTDSKSTHKVDLKIILLRRDSKLDTESSASLNSELQGVSEADSKTSTALKTEEPIKDEEESGKQDVSKLKVPQRKISRFLVSPVLSGKLDLPKDKDYGTTSEPEKIDSASTAEKTAPPTLNKTEEKKTEVGEKQETPPQKVEEAKVCGPEMINTLEQLKISLQNLTHSHASHKKDSTEGSESKAQSGGGTTTQPQPKQTPQNAPKPQAPQQNQSTAVIQTSQPQISTPQQQQVYFNLKAKKKRF